MSTICAISTPGGVGGIAVIRISGPDAISIADRLWLGKSLKQCDSHTAHLGWITDCNGDRLDQGVATLFRAPRSFTGEDTVEFSVHGSLYIQRELLNSLIVNGCRMAEAGEFTRRAFTSGHLDLAEAEAVADVIASTSRASHRLAVSQMKGDFSQRIEHLRESLLELASLLELELDFSDQEVEFASRECLMKIAIEVKSTVNTLAGTFHRGQAFRTGIPTAIIGATNVGKSTLLNRLLHDDRAIVSDIHGTTRDTIEDTAEIGGVIFRFIDTAGLRDTCDTIEAMGIDRSLQRIRNASIIILVADSTRPETLGEAWHRIEETLLDRTSAPHPYPTLLLLWNKSDIDNNQPDITSKESQEDTGNHRHSDTIVENGQNKYEPTLIEKQIRNFCDVNNMELYQAHYSAKTGEGCDIESLLMDCAGTDMLDNSDIIVTNARHYQSLINASDSISRVIDGLTHNIPPEFVAQDLRQTLSYLGEITGTISTPQILSSIFSRFCIGK
ncbi:tRNA uridine-5-carboxymethylaminomethyl(34) synthesis GTPase MnmE [Muribaculum sp.]|uniref:tRNA uridine-5-carboxymethylaminomethyl(34) synthesis GTPase MnmE n=1 Tax=Muribaculum sp. TaxID=1918611 RepID=UPI0023BCEA71|nr:tRNA uridine-5-carboxymethylaminomethyl(34) synthesis GTPase MnmE [Muribaculum sp.]MDE5705920.1 tRNA uridine-5-carboxymethylaminomethyl(34) synthesis GTPase MnmE [Muribaculum sp.]